MPSGFGIVKMAVMERAKATAIAFTSLALLFAACGGGQSAASKASDDVCTASSDTLSADRKQQVQSATQTFKDQLATPVAALGTSLSAADAKSQLQSALDALAASYQQSLGTINCS
jgi:hypothetical protein